MNDTKATATEMTEMQKMFRDCEKARHLLVLGGYGFAQTLVHHDRERDLMRVEAPGFPPAVCSRSLYLQTYGR